MITKKTVTKSITSTYESDLFETSDGKHFELEDDAKRHENEYQKAMGKFKVTKIDNEETSYKVPKYGDWVYINNVDELDELQVAVDLKPGRCETQAWSKEQISKHTPGWFLVYVKYDEWGGDCPYEKRITPASHFRQEAQRILADIPS